MNADQLREIRERHMSDEQRMVFTQGLPSFMGTPGFRPTDHEDRAALLAEVDRLTTNIEDGSRTNANLRAEVERLRAFVEKVRGAEREYEKNRYVYCSATIDAALTELRASK